MANNSSLVVGESLLRQINYQVIIVQILVISFLCVNLLLIVTFFRKECFHTTARYILFAVTLMSDSVILFVSDILLILSYFRFTMQRGMCIALFFTVYLYFVVTPLTLTAMTLERYVAICMPLRHAELCSTRSTMHFIVIIHGLSSVPSIVILAMIFSSVSISFCKQFTVCSIEMLLVHEWQDHLRSAINQFYFLMMCIIIVFSYVKIMKVAKAASGEDKKSTWKGLKTVILHGFQLLLSLIQLWCPFIESTILQFDFMLFVQIRYFNYVMFSLAPRCLSPLIYGLRDEKFFLELKSFGFFGLYSRNF
ncbi:odorant receptor 131-2-like [Larimichthys crocea]|uniref:odorant receptor 131-2-like n=1 Tax=Larimichthys crocea TaxID=215358 RepID=UPI000F5E1FD0|nr:odorant receptor 131-2-like [Larimichthys crocea]